ncbi:MAG TPA: ABC transporter permease subunit [Pseudonocardiaceae bacterium]|jgi:ABC-type transport system involved in multi-copper enzyme maturation permease subunit|nr:ABC transporter permease subunit [Pseudonocardiaceae bacterium]
MTSSTTIEPTPKAPAHGSNSAIRGGVPADLKVTQLRVIKSEWLKFRSLRSSYYSLIAAVVCMIGFGCLFAAVTAARWSDFRPAERANFDPTSVSLRGFFLVQLIVGVLGVLVVTGEYSTGMIRSSLSAAPHRLPVLWAKAIVFALVTFVVTTVSAFIAFFAGQAILSSQHLETTLSAPGVLRAVIGTGLYLTVVGLLGVALGWVVRHTAGAIATLFGLLLILPALAEALPTDWQQNISKYLPNNAGEAVFSIVRAPDELAPWAGFGVFCAYLVAGIVAAVVLLKRRDA